MLNAIEEFISADGEQPGATPTDIYISAYKQRDAEALTDHLRNCRFLEELPQTPA